MGLLSQPAGSPVDPNASKIAKEIVNDIAARGAIALKHHCIRLGDIQVRFLELFVLRFQEGEPIVLDKDEMKRQFLSLPEEQQLLLQRSADRVRKFASAQRDCIKDLFTPVQGILLCINSLTLLGGTAGHSVAAVSVAGCYAPGGRYPLPSSVLMTAVTAKAAGVERVFVSSPRPNLLTVGAAYVSGADFVLRAGGAQAIAAMAYGAEGIVSPCDIIVGPGNKYVTAAKALVSGIVALLPAKF